MKIANKKKTWLFNDNWEEFYFSYNFRKSLKIHLYSLEPEVPYLEVYPEVSYFKPSFLNSVFKSYSNILKFFYLFILKTSVSLRYTNWNKRKEMYINISKYLIICFKDEKKNF